MNVRPGEEDEIQIRFVKPCGRCKMTTVFPDEGRMADDGEPLKTLKKYRLGRDVGYVQEEFATQVGCAGS